MRPINEIALDVYKNWHNVNFAARPYLHAMLSLNDITDNYGMDSAHTIIIYFLANARTWKGETAKRIKKELNQLIK